MFLTVFYIEITFLLCVSVVVNVSLEYLINLVSSLFRSFLVASDSPILVDSYLIISLSFKFESLTSSVLANLDISLDKFKKSYLGVIFCIV